MFLYPVTSQLRTCPVVLRLWNFRRPTSVRTVYMRFARLAGCLVSLRPWCPASLRPPIHGLRVFFRVLMLIDFSFFPVNFRVFFVRCTELASRAHVLLRCSARCTVSYAVLFWTRQGACRHKSMEVSDE